MSTPILIPEPNKSAIRKALSVLFEPSDVIELRAIYKTRKRIDAGYFDGEHWSELSDEAVRLNKAGAAVYVTLNQLDPQLLGRFTNRVQDFAADTATDANVKRRRWLLIDIDPVRPKDTASTDAQLEAACEKARSCRLLLKEEGWPEPQAGQSGNGFHLLYPLDLPNDPEATALIKGALVGLADRLDDDVVQIDRSVFNAARITKLFGSVANKGDHTTQHPWRLATLVSTPPRVDVVTPDQLRALQPKSQAPASVGTVQHTSYRQFDLEGFLGRLRIPYVHDQHEGSDRYKLDHCPFDPAHAKGEAAIFQRGGGALAFKCVHNSCSGNDWKALRDLIDGPREARNSTSSARTPDARTSRPATTSANEGDCDRWPEPQPLAVKVEPEPYPLDALPEPIRAAVAEVQGFTKAPIAMVASSAMAALSLAIQAHYDVQRADKLQGPVALFLLTIADSGERKSTCDGFFTKAIRDYEETQAEAAKPILKDYKAAMEAWEAKRGGVKDKIRQLAKANKPTLGLESALCALEHDKPEPPRIPYLLYADATPEALAYGLATQWPSGGVVSAEAGIVFGSHGMGRDSVMRNLALLNQLWDGTTLKFNRRSSPSFIVRGARLTVALQVQEPTLREFFARSGALARGTGFLARFLVAWPQSTQGFRPFTDAPPNWPHLAEFHRRIAAILAQPVPMDDDGALCPTIMMLAPDAKAAWVAFHDTIERELASGGELYDVRDVASKCADNAARLAAEFHVFDDACGAVTLSAFDSASRIAAWHLNEARRFFGELALPVELANAARLDSWLIAYCRREQTNLVPIAKLQQGGPSGLRDKATIQIAVRELEDANRARLIQEGKRRYIRVNPALVGGNAS